MRNAARQICFLLLILLPAPVFAQCYDLKVTRLYEAEGRFKEWWKDSDFRLDKSEWGDREQFAPFTLGVVRKTASGWEPASATRHPKTYCDWSGPKGTSRCFNPLFDKIPPGADPRPADTYVDIETWQLSHEGVLTYKHHSVVYRGPMGEHGGFESISLLDLNTGLYSVETHGHAIGVHQHIDPKGIELWRETPFHATAKLTSIACPAKIAAASLGGENPPERELSDPGPCVVRVDQFANTSALSPPKIWKFVINPQGTSVPDACILVSEKPAPALSDRSKPSVRAEHR
jgi:hypothetical protein